MTEKTAADTFGEVFTPSVLVSEMLSSIPENFWRRKNLRIIDNSCGDGAFLVAVKQILTKYHSEEQANNMLFGIDIQEKNVFAARKKLGSNNIVLANALKYKYGSKFDLVVGNPPYNKEKSGKKGNNCNPLWPLFVEKALNILAPKGYLLYVHPPLWRKPGHHIGDLFRERQLVEVHMFTTEKSSKLFGCFTKVDWYLLRNTSSSEKTIVVDEKGIEQSVFLRDRKFIPNHSLNEVYSIFSGETEVVYSCAYHHYTHKDVQSTKDDTHPHPCIYLINKNGISLYYSASDKRGHFGTSKIVVSMGTGKSFLDIEGKYGMCEICFGLPIKNKEHGEALLKYIQSENFLNILNACKWKTVQIDYKLFRFFNDPVIEG